MVWYVRKGVTQPGVLGKTTGKGRPEMGGITGVGVNVSTAQMLQYRKIGKKRTRGQKKL
jgi:hypothetical protein